MLSKNELIKLGFSCNTKFTNSKGNVMTELSITYYEIEIFYQRIHTSINCDNLFIKICSEYKNNYLS